MKVRRVIKYQRGNQNFVNPRRTDNTAKEIPKDKQKSTKHTHKAKDQVARTPLKTGGGLMCSGRVSSSRTTSGTRHVKLITSLITSNFFKANFEMLC